MMSENHLFLVLNKSDRVQENGPGGASIQWLGEQVIKRQPEWGGGIREDKMDGRRD